MNGDLQRALAPAGRIGSLLVAAGVLLWGASGLYSVGPEQRGVVRRFGAVVDDGVPPGIHYHWPWPIETVDRPAVTEIRSLTVTFGAAAAAQGKSAAPRRDDALLTGDANVVLGTLLIQYTLNSPRKFLFGAESPEELLTRAVQEATVARVGQLNVDDVLTSGRHALQAGLKEDVQRRADAWGLGVRLSAVQIQRMEPPAEVAAAFKDVGAAREDKEKLVQEAEGERNRKLPEARSESGRVRSEAAAYAKERVSFATGEAERFVSTWNAYRESKSVTAERIYLETVEEAMTRVTKIIVNPDAERNVKPGS